MKTVRYSIYTFFLIVCAYSKPLPLISTQAVPLHASFQQAKKAWTEDQVKAQSQFPGLKKLKSLVKEGFTSDGFDFVRNPTSPVPLPVDLVKKVIGSYVEVYLKFWGGPALEGSVEKISIDTKKVLAVGDLHGSIFSLLNIFTCWAKQGLLDAETYCLAQDAHIVFLGDYIDRGEGSIEVLTLLLQFKLKNWSQVTLIRGNHEGLGVGDSDFASQLCRIYPSKDAEWLLKELQEKVFNTFPLAVFLGVGKTFSSREFSYALFCHGMVDEALAKATEAILKDRSASWVRYENSSQKSYASKEVAWGDVFQCFSQDPDEKPIRQESWRRLGRPAVNMSWIEENFLKKYPQVKTIVRAHQHNIGEGVLIPTESWKKIVGSDKELYERLSKGPYSEGGPFLRGYFNHTIFPVHTTSAARMIKDIPLSSLCYLEFIPEENDAQMLWKSSIHNVDEDSIVAASQKTSSCVPGACVIQ